MDADRVILVTGASGFLGSRIVQQARCQGLNVVAAHRAGTGPGVAHMDVCDPNSVDDAIRNAAPTVVIHCAAYGVNYAEQDFQRALHVNTIGAVAVLEAAARHGVQRFIHIGSCFEYGSRDGLISENTVLQPTAVYGATKAAAALLLRERARGLKPSLVILRPFALWGIGEPAHRIIPQVVSACLTGVPLKLTSCEVIRDYTYVEDMAANILSIALLPEIESGTVINLGSGRGVLLRDFVLSVARLLSGEALMQFGALPYRPTEMSSLVADVTRMRSFLGVVRETSLVDGVKRMVESMRTHNIS